MMLLALTRRPLRDMWTSQAKPPASLVSLAEARACSPSLLLIVAARLDHCDVALRAWFCGGDAVTGITPWVAPATARATSASSGSFVP